MWTGFVFLMAEGKNPEGREREREREEEREKKQLHTENYKWFLPTGMEGS